MKTCSKCKEEKSLDQFHADKRRINTPTKGVYAHCITCHREYHKNRDPVAIRERARELEERRREDDPTRVRRANLKRYGITLEDYNSMHEDQEGRCAICNGTDTGCSHHNNLCVDHCHDTGIVRGLLCNSCNKGLGHFRDEVERLEKAITYLTDS
jgi:hypothetical protein